MATKWNWQDFEFKLTDDQKRILAILRKNNRMTRILWKKEEVPSTWDCTQAQACVYRYYDPASDFKSVTAFPFSRNEIKELKTLHLINLQKKSAKSKELFISLTEKGWIMALRTQKFKVGDRIKILIDPWAKSDTQPQWSKGIEAKSDPLFYPDVLAGTIAEVISVGPEVEYTGVTVCLGFKYKGAKAGKHTGPKRAGKRTWWPMTVNTGLPTIIKISSGRPSSPRSTRSRPPTSVSSLFPWNR